MITIAQRLQFEDVFPDEKKEDVVYYIKKVSKETLLRTIGFCNTNPTTNFDNFFTNPTLEDNIFEKVIRYSKKNNIKEKPILISKYASLKLAEHILAQKDLLEKPISIDEDELNLFKAFLVINTELNNNQKFDNLNSDNFEKLVDLTLTFKFPESDLALFSNDDLEFLKLIYTTIYKVDELLKFLNSNDDFVELKVEFLKSFNTDSEEEFIKHMKFLFGKLLESKITKNYTFEVDDDSALNFLKSMSSENIKIDEDFTVLKNNPIYFLEDNLFSIVNYFFAVDKFYRSTKFKLKEIYESKESLKKKYGNFFGFFNKNFSEDFLMKNLLDDIFHKKYFVKKPDTEKELDGEPDYYIRYDKNIFLFENKDVLVSKSLKSSGNIDDINRLLESKFVKDGKKSVGIGQIINSIQEIQDKKFRYDEGVNSDKKFTIYPILLIQDRIFQSPGVNYRLNNWYKAMVKEKLENSYDKNYIKGLTVIDIDTLIFWAPYLKQKDRHFKEILIDHLKRMETHKKINASTEKEELLRKSKNLMEQLGSISSRKIPFIIPTEDFVQMFKEVIID